MNQSGRIDAATLAQVLANRTRRFDKQGERFYEMPAAWPGRPRALEGRGYYRPVARGLEIKLKEKLDALRAAREDARRRGDGADGPHPAILPAWP